MDGSALKKCNDCKELLTLDNFTKNSSNKDLLNRKCKLCYSRLKIRSKSYRREERWRSKYGLSKESFINMWIEQNGNCAICMEILPHFEVHEQQRGKESIIACIDHCHETGVIRGLLCNKCNTALGFFKDSLSSLQRAYFYLQKFKI